MSVAVAFGLTDMADAAILAAAQTVAARPLDVFASIVTITGRAEVTGAAALVLTFFWVRSDRMSGWAPLALFVAVAIEIGFKFLVPHAPPPTSVLRDINLLQVVRSDPPYAFPSGHVTRVTLLSILIARRAPWSRPIVAAWVVIMCVTRIYEGSHWTSDVVGGLLFGGGMGLVATPVTVWLTHMLTRLRR